MNFSLKLLTLLVSTLLLTACGGSSPPTEPSDAGVPPADSGSTHDAGDVPAGDGGTEDGGSQPPPQPPVLTGTQPAARGSEPQPQVLGTAEPGVTVELYNGSLCPGAALVTGTADADGRFAIRFPVTRNATTHITAKARRGTRASECSRPETSAVYVHDDLVPQVNTVTPARDATGVSLTVAAVARFSEPMNEASVKLDVTCGGQPVAGSLVASGDQVTFTPSASLPEQTACTVTVREGADLTGNTLAAEYSWSFTTLRVPSPNPPTFTGTTPASPGNNATPAVSGQSSAGYRVELFTTSDCSGPAVASGTASAAGIFSIPAPVTPNASTTFRAQALDSAGRRSTCSPTFITYVHDGVAPTVVSTTPVTDATGVLRGAVVRVTLSEAVKGVASDLTLTCGGQARSGATSFSGTQVTFTPSSSLPYDVTCTATLAATVTDLVGNELGAAYSWSFVMEPSPPPSTPSLTSLSPVSPNRTLTPSVVGTATAGVTVEILTPDCAGTLAGSGTADALGNFSIPVTVAANSSTSFRAQARSAVGRLSGCSSQTRTYVHDDVAPTVASTVPASGAVDVATNTQVSATFNESVKNTSGALTVQCGGVTVQGSVIASSTTLTFTATQPLPLDVTCTAQVSTRVTDLANNPLAAVYSWSFTMRESPPPGPPTLTGTTPASPGNSTTPSVLGSATAGHLIELYLSDNCSGTPLASGTVNAQGRFAIPVTVAANSPTLIYATARFNATRPSSPCTPQALVYRHDGVVPTVVAVSPVNDATDVQPAATLTVDFSELITAQTGDVELRCGGTLLPGTVSVVDRRLRFAPAVQLWLEEVCTATVKTGVRDLAGNALASDYSWAFMTRPYGWSPGPVVATASGAVTNVEAALSSAGNATLVWRAGTSPFATTRHDLNPQQGVSTGLRLSTANSQSPVVGTSPNGHVVMAWLEYASQQPTRLMASVYIPGTGWSTPATLVSSIDFNPNYAQVAIDNSGHALVVFRQHANDFSFPYSLYARRFVPGSGWQGLTEIDGVPDWVHDMREPSVTRDGRGGFLVVWGGEPDVDTTNRYHLMFNWLRVGTTPGSATWTGARYFLNEIDARVPRAGCDAQGNCIIAYWDDVSDTAKAIRYDAASQSWGTAIALAPGSSRTREVNVAVNANGQAVAAFTYYSSALLDHEVMVRQYEPGVGWSDPLVVGPSAGLDTGLLDVGIDAQGNAVVLSRQGSSTRLYASRYRVGLGWSSAAELDTGVGWRSGGDFERQAGARVAVNASGQVLVSYWKSNSVYAHWLP
jgi:hypothetical protein